MTYYNRIDVSEGRYINKTVSLPKCIIGTFGEWIIDFKQKSMMVVMIWHKNPRVFIVLRFVLLEEMIKGFIFMTKCEAVNRMENVDSSLKKWDVMIMEKNIYCNGNM